MSRVAVEDSHVGGDFSVISLSPKPVVRSLLWQSWRRGGRHTFVGRPPAVRRSYGATIPTPLVMAGAARVHVGYLFGMSLEKPSLRNLKRQLEARGARALFQLPAPLLDRLAGPPRVIAGKTLDPRVQLLIRLFVLSGRRSSHTLTVAQAREELRNNTTAMCRRPAVRVTETELTGENGLKMRRFRPENVESPAPALVFLHGGGFVLGDLDSHAPLCREVAAGAGLEVIAIDYRLAPEHPFPAAVEDAVAGFRWVMANAATLGIDPSRVGVGGDSAGGNLAAVVAGLTRQDPHPPRLQWLLYPAIDLRMIAASIETFAEGFLLERDTMRWFLDHYLGGDRERALDPRASPCFADVTGVAPALIQTAGFDPLVDEGAAYAQQLRAAHIPVAWLDYPSLVHGFAHITAIAPEAARAIDAAIGLLRDKIVVKARVTS